MRLLMLAFALAGPGAGLAQYVAPCRTSTCNKEFCYGARQCYSCTSSTDPYTCIESNTQAVSGFFRETNNCEGSICLPGWYRGPGCSCFGCSGYCRSVCLPQPRDRPG